jgi:signal transduction histidine kinase
MEVELKETSLQLRAEIAERQRIELALLLKQKLESVGQLAAGIAHEINTPVQFVSDSVHFLREALDDYSELANAQSGLNHALAQGLPTASLLQTVEEIGARIDLPYLHTHVPRAIDRAGEGLERIATIVRSMKEFAHPDQLEMSYIDVNHAVVTTLEVARNEYKYVADVTTDFAELPPVHCYGGEINQVVLNLVVNAAHAIADANRGRGTIHVSTRHVDDEVWLQVRDTGCGISDDVLARIFDPFFTTKEVGRGTGQGLAIARSIVVDKHAGSIDVATDVGRGTTFTIRLPLFAPGRAQVAA